MHTTEEGTCNVISKGVNAGWFTMIIGTLGNSSAHLQGVDHEQSQLG